MKTPAKDLINIRQLKISDIEEIVQLQLTNSLDWWNPNDYENEIKREDTLSFVAKSKEITAGFIVSRLIMQNFPPNYQQKTKMHDENSQSETETKIRIEIEIEIYNIAIEKSFRKKGIGTLLIEKIVQKSLRHNPSLISIWLEVRASNSSAVSFYQKNGFEAVYLRKNFYRYPQEDAIVMRKVIADGA